jgi:hypothetical protein
MRLAPCLCSRTDAVRYCCLRFRGLESLLPTGLPPSLPFLLDDRVLAPLVAAPRQAGQKVTVTVISGTPCDLQCFCMFVQFIS